MLAPIEPINKGNVVDQIIACITDMIIEGKYKAGDKLPNEYELIQELQVSRNSLREAIKILSAMGIVEISRGNGTYVCNQMKASLFDSAIYSIIFGQSTKEELKEFRIIIDAEIARQAMISITDEQVLLLRENLKEIQTALNNRDFARAKELDYEFHMLLIDSCKNRFFIRVTKGIYAVFQKSIANTVGYEKEMSDVVRQHTNILNCVINKDTEHVEQVIADSLQTWAIVAKSKKERE